MIDLPKIDAWIGHSWNYLIRKIYKFSKFVYIVLIVPLKLLSFSSHNDLKLKKNESKLGSGKLTVSIM